MKVAIYLRKSRGELDDLSKHKMQLVELAEKHQWSFIIYEEIGSSDSLEERPEFMRMLDHIEEYEKVLVVALDRLSRNQLHQAQILQLFKENDIEVLTPTRVYNFTEETDIMTSDFEMLLARQEYRLSKKRLQQGKINGAKQGKFVNGRPPLGYLYNQVTKEVEISEEQAKVYRYIVDKVLSGEYSAYSLAFELNKQNVPTSYGGKWNNNGVYRLLLSEFHLGKVKYKDIWYDGTHIPLKTQEEHDKILLLFNKRGKVPDRRRKNKFSLSGLVKCQSCGHTMTVAQKNGSVFVKPCWHTDDVGNKCGNRGILEQVVLNELKLEIGNRVDDLNDSIASGQSDINRKRKETLMNEIGVLQTSLQGLEEKKNRILDMAENAIYDIVTGKEKLNDIERQKSSIQKEISVIKLAHDSINENLETELITLESIHNAFTTGNISEHELNTLLRKIIKQIKYRRQDDELFMEIEYL